MDDLIDRQAAIDALHTWFRDGFDEDKWWNSTHVLAAIEGLPSAQQGYKWETCFECPLSHGCPKIKGCTNEQAIEYASQIPNDCPLSAQPDHIADISKKAEKEDCISRQVAIDDVCKMMYECFGADDEELDAIEVTLRELPAAQPERDIPIKPNETTDTACGIPHRQAVCPKCDYYLGHVVFIGDGKSKKVTYCETCGQAIDWEGWNFDE